MKKRIILNLVLLVVVIYLPWWAMIMFGVMGAFLCAPYYEIVAFGVLFDVLYGASLLSFGGVIGLVTSVLIFVFGIVVRKRVR